ncbi:MAG: phosphoribosylanthranilate isomerase [Rikenellaceae bacterium]
MKIKVCGMREGENILAIEQLGVDMIGFIFYPKSPRYVEQCPSNLPSKAAKVGVFVDAQIEFITSKVESFELDYVQLHGAESVELCETLTKQGMKIIKAFAVDESFDFNTTKPYEHLCNLFVFDTKCGEHGGSGRQFDWSTLDAYAGSTPFLLSGGIGLESIDALKNFRHPRLAGYDLNSRFEKRPTIKDTNKLSIFLEELELKRDE